MSSHENKNRKYYGPPRMESPSRDIADIQSRRGMPGGMSPEDRYNRMYGERGVGWDFDTTRHDQDNEMRRAGDLPEATLAREGMRNWLYKGRYETDDGINLKGKVNLYAARPDMGDVVVYPDGDVHRASQSGNETIVTKPRQ